MLIVFTLLIMLGGAYLYYREGVFTAFCMCVNVLVAGLVSFNFWEPIANLFERGFAGYTDLLVMVPLFCLTLGGLRLLTNHLARGRIEYPLPLQQVGGAAVGLLIGYLVSGFLICVFQTLPWHASFMGFAPRAKDEGLVRRYLPPDRTWLSLMRYAGAGPFSWGRVSDPISDSPYDVYDTFDRDGTFELRYLRYRRYGDSRRALPYQGELEPEPASEH